MRLRRLQYIILVILAIAPLGFAQRFLSDDPLGREPAPRDASGVRNRKLNDYYDLLENSFTDRGKPGKNGERSPARNVNTLGETIDGAWYTHRHYWQPMSNEELARGPGGSNPPSMDGPWTIISAKSEGISPGFVMKDSKGDRYFVKFDPMSNPELATGAEMISARLFHALGYHVPDYYLIHFSRDRLALGDDVAFVDPEKRKRKMTRRDLYRLLKRVPTARDGTYRGIASLQIPGKPVGPFKYFGVRSDDPNDVVPHQLRRELRGMYVFAAWLNHNDCRSINTLDVLVNDGPAAYVRHYLIDFGSTLGSWSTAVKPARVGGEYYLDFDDAPKQMFTFGLLVPYWAKADHPNYRSVGGFEAATFDPDRWLPDYPNAAFLNRLPDDEFWAAKQVMAFTNEQIRAIVKSARYSDPAAERYVADTLIARRDKIGRTFLGRVLPLDRFAIENGELRFRDLAREHGLETKGPLQIAWSRFDNGSQKKTPIPEAAGFRLPSEAQGGSASSYVAADIWRGDDRKKVVTVYLRDDNGRTEIVGIDRTW